jgi:hypothetical protein
MESEKLKVKSRRARFHFSLFTFLFSLAATVTLSAQAPAANWRTITTRHFRIHYPAPYEAWTMRAATRLESVREAVVREAGFDPPQVIDVVVSNPVADPNGLAWPFLDTPRIELYAEPPSSDESLGGYGHWIDLLTVHEVTHIVHMLRPSRNPLRRIRERLVLPLNPIALSAPRWVLEGYATVIEGRLTGAGRPPSTLRAAVLRKWAENGRLPTYAQLDSDDRFLGMSMAYLAGSAYLEWLERRGGEGSLRRVWARMTARNLRTFDEAFTGVFGEPPERLYGRFAAELTANALAIARSGERREGELWQETSRATGDPAVSPDGSQLALVLRPRTAPMKLVILSAGDDGDEAKKDRERIEKMLHADPEDVAPIRIKPLPRKPKHILALPDGGDIQSPRWLRDGRSILYSHRARNAKGFLQFDLYRWTPESGENVRVTTLADVRDADPHPDGTQAVAVRSRNGMTQLVRVNLADGSVTPIGTPSLDAIQSTPRFSPDGAQTSWVEHRHGRWRLMIDGNEVALDGDVATPEWTSNGELVAAISKGGFSEIHRVTPGPPGPMNGAMATPITHTTGAALSPAPAPDGRIFFMSLEPDGLVTRVLPANAPAAPAPALPAGDLVPALPPPPALATPFAAQPVSPPRPYGLGRQEWTWFASTNHSASYDATEVGVRVGDVVGRVNLLLLGSFGDREGIALATSLRRWPIRIGAHAYHSGNDDGLELRGSWARQTQLASFRLEGGALTANDDKLFGEGRAAWNRRFGGWRAASSALLAVEAGDATHTRAVVRGGFGNAAFLFTIQLQHDQGSVIALGGLPTSILPRAVSASRVFDPALPLATLRGDRYDGRRAELTLARFPMTAFYQQHEIGGRQLSVTGLEFTLSSDPLPILKYPGIDLRAGVARILDEPLRGDTQWWLGMRWRP